MTARRAAKATLMTLGSWYHRARAWHPIWWHGLNWRARSLYRAHPPHFSAEERAIVDALSRCGIAVTHVDALLGTGVLAELAAYARRRWTGPDVRERMDRRGELLAGGKPKSKGYFLIDLWPGERALDLLHPFIRFSIAEPILRIVASYLGLWPKFRDWRLEVTVPMGGGLGPYASQKWHRDEEDQKLVKTFLYLNDVDERTGPFMYLLDSHGGGRRRDLFPLAPPRGSLPMPANADNLIPADEVFTAVGRAGTLIFCDTSGLHRGGLAAAGQRFMYTSIYTTPASPWPIRYRYPPGFSLAGLDEMARYAVANNPNQRPPRFYR